MNRRKISILILVGLLYTVMISGVFSAESGKMTVAVMEFRNTSNYPGEWHLGQGMADMLATSLFKTGKFNVVERERLDQIMQEKNLARAGEVNSKEAAALGQLIGADYIVTGNVTEFGISNMDIGGSAVDRDGGGRGPRGRRSGGGVNFGGFGLKTQTARVVVDVRIVDAKTGQLVAAENAEGKESTGSITAGGGDWNSYGAFKFGSSGFDSTLPGKATRKAINTMVERISGSIYSPKIIDVSGDEVTLNVGSSSGIKKNTKMNVISEGKELRDPDTGEVLGRKRTVVGVIKITDVQEKISTGHIEKGSGTIEPGNLVEK